MSYTNDTQQGRLPKPPALRVLNIVDGTIVDGPGLRTSIYLAGCRHACPGCHNPQSWDFGGGKAMAVEDLVAHIDYEGLNVTLSGGDPLYQIDGVLELCWQLKQLGVNIWCYTGFTYEQVSADPDLSPILSLIDVLVDGPYIEAKRDLSLHFRGSSNQRIIDCTKSTPTKIVLWQR